MRDNEKKINQYIKKLEKMGKSLSDVTDKTINQLKNANAFKKFEKQVKRVLERDKIREEVKRYEEKLKAKQERKNEEIFKQFPWVKKVMKFDAKYQNIKDAKTVYERKMNEERMELKNLIGKYFNKKNRDYKSFVKDIDSEKDIFVLTSFLEKAEYIIEAYGIEDNEGNFTFSLGEDEVLERLHSHFRIEKLESKFKKG